MKNKKGPDSHEPKTLHTMTNIYINLSNVFSFKKHLPGRTSFYPKQKTLSGV